MVFIYYKDSKTLNITKTNALAGRTQRMADQKVGFTPRPIRYGPHNWLVSSSAALKLLHIKDELENPVMGPIP